MKKYILVLILAVVAFNCFAQKENRHFSNPVETKPRFKNDIDLSEVENRKSFDKRIQNHFLKNFKVDTQDFEIIKKSNYFLTFSIDTSGKATYKNIKVLKKGNKLSDKFIQESNRVINLLPSLIPATQRGIAVKVIYVIPITNKYFKVE